MVLVLLCCFALTAFFEIVVGFRQVDSIWNLIVVGGASVFGGTDESRYHLYEILIEGHIANCRALRRLLIGLQICLLEEVFEELLSLRLLLLLPHDLPLLPLEHIKL